MAKVNLSLFPDALRQYNCPLPFYIEQGNYVVKTAQSPAEIKQVAAFRYQNFLFETGRANASGELDWLAIDDCSSHVMVCRQDTDELIAVCRLNTSGTWYAASEFDIYGFF